MSILHVPPDVTPIAPTVCMNWLKCPTYGYLAKHWEPMGEWTPNRLLGIAVGKGLEVLLDPSTNYDAVGEKGPTREDAVELAILGTLRDGYQEQDNWPLDALQTLALKGYRAACKTVIKDIQEREKVLGTELGIGGARVDLVTSRGLTRDGADALPGPQDLIVTDYKTKLQCKPEWVTRDLLESECDWQLWDYAWRVSEYYGRPVTFKRRVIIVLSPTAKAYVHETPVTEAGLNAWLAGAIEEWEYIDKFRGSFPRGGELVGLPMRTTSCYGTRFGKCSMYEACWSADRDPERMRALYVER